MYELRFMLLYIPLGRMCTAALGSLRLWASQSEAGREAVAVFMLHRPGLSPQPASGQAPPGL